MPDNMLRFIKDVIYSLKRDYGGPLDLYRDTIISLDRSTGEKEVTKEKWHIHRAIRLPRNIHRDVIFSATGNRLFQYGNVIETADRNVIIDARDIPKGLVIQEENWYLIIDDERYEIRKAEKFDFNAAYFLILKKLVGKPLERIVEITVKHQIGATQTIDNTT